MGIKGWSLRDGILEGEGWRGEMLGRLFGGKQRGSPHMALSEDAECVPDFQNFCFDMSWYEFADSFPASSNLMLKSLSEF